MSKVVGIKLTDADYARWKFLADEGGLSVSMFVRLCVACKGADIDRVQGRTGKVNPEPRKVNLIPDHPGVKWASPMINTMPKVKPREFRPFTKDQQLGKKPKDQK